MEYEIDFPNMRVCIAIWVSISVLKLDAIKLIKQRM